MPEKGCPPSRAQTSKPCGLDGLDQGPASSAEHLDGPVNDRRASARVRTCTVVSSHSFWCHHGMRCQVAIGLCFYGDDLFLKTVVSSACW